MVTSSSSGNWCFPEVQMNPNPSSEAPWQGPRFTVDYVTLLVLSAQLRLLPAEFDASVCIPWFALIFLDSSCVYSSLLWQPPAPPLSCSSLCYSHLPNLLTSCLPSPLSIPVFSVDSAQPLVGDTQRRDQVRSQLQSLLQGCVTGTSVPHALAETEQEGTLENLNINCV